LEPFPTSSELRALAAKRLLMSLCVTMAAPLRIELFFKTVDELRLRVRELRAENINAYNLVNKHKDDAMLEWVDAIIAENPRADICAHFSLKNNAVGIRQGGADAMAQRFARFADDLAERSAERVETLLVTGCNSRAPLDSLSCLQRWATKQAASALHRRCRTPVGVAFNPYLPPDGEQEKERERLLQKLESCAVSSVWLQFGTDLQALESACSWLLSLGKKRPGRIVGSLFLPTRQLIAQQRYRPWNGVFLSEAYLSGPETAANITVELLGIYQRFEIEVLVEAPGVRSRGDLELVRTLVGRAASLPAALSGKAPASPTMEAEVMPREPEETPPDDGVSKRPAAKRWRKVGTPAAL